jgi:aldose 1-epimerase
MPAKESFEKVIDGKHVSLFKLKNSLNTELCITNYGCRIVSLKVGDKNGDPADVVMGFDSIDGYLQTTEVYHGATIGRYSNRIEKGNFHLKEKEYHLALNNPPNHLHGGPGGFHTKVWDVEKFDKDSITLSYLSVDGEEDYPGNLKIKVRFNLSEQNEVIISYEAVTDQSTVLNVTNHAYFNLNGLGSGTILNHLLQINAEHYTPVGETLIPYGNLESVAGTPFDFTSPFIIGERINEDHLQLKYGNGYDHNYVLNKSGLEPNFAARVIADKTGIILEVFTDQPGMQFYTANFKPAENITKGPVPDHFRTAFCLETQHFPDSPHHFNFPSTVLNPREIFHSTTIYKFSTMNGE